MLLSSTPVINIFMATKNPRVVGYVAPDDHAKLQQFMKEYDCTESKAIALILHSYFTSTPVSTPASRVNEARSNTPNCTLDNTLVERLEALENKIEALNGTPSNTIGSDEVVTRIAELEKKLEAFSNTPDSTLYNELLKRLEALENREKALSNTPNGTLNNLLTQDVAEANQALSDRPSITSNEAVVVGKDNTFRHQPQHLDEVLRQTAESFSKDRPKANETHKASNSNYKSLEAIKQQLVEGMSPEAIATTPNDEPDPEEISGITKPATSSEPGDKPAVEGLVEPETILSNIPGIAPDEVAAVEVVAVEAKENSAQTDNNLATVEPEEAGEAVVIADEPATDFSKGVFGKDLAARLGRDAGSITKHQQKGDLSEWSKDLDPDGISWEKRGRLYFPVV